jgi:hypothetical protein
MNTDGIEIPLVRKVKRMVAWFVMAGAGLAGSDTSAG